MKIALALTASLFASTITAHADFSYTTTQKATGGQMGAMAAGSNTGSKFYLKGQKMMTQSGESATILDFDAQTITTLNTRQKTVTVRKFSDLAASVGDFDAKIDVKETGQKKVINGYNASELVITMQMDAPGEAAQMGKMQMEMDMWMSSDPPGVKELRAFYQRNMSRFPWAAMSGGAAGNASMQKAMAEMQRKMAEINGVNVMQVMKMKAPGGAAAMPAMPQMTPEQMQQMQAAMAKLQAQGGPGAAQAQQALARMQAMQSGAGASSGSLIEMTMESTDFSTNPIPDSVFAIPAGYQKVDSK